MSVSTADELMSALSELRELFPDWRLGQLIENLAMAAGRTEEDAVWNVEDEEMLAAARRLIEQNRDRRSVES